MHNAKKKGFIFIVTASILTSCISNQKIPDSDNTALDSLQISINNESPADEQNEVLDQLVITPELALDTFDPQNVSIELKKTTFFDAKALIQKLNAIIQAKTIRLGCLSLALSILSIILQQKPLTACQNPQFLGDKE
ncbi:hypothetical protein MASR2M29_23450 [Spirochaetota bacterium]